MSLTADSPIDILPAPVRAVAPYLLLALFVFVAYGNIFDNGFLFDDDLLITINAFIRDWHHLGDILTGSTTGGAHIAGGFYRPLQILLYLFAHHIGDGATLPFHLLNLGLHIANTCLVYKLGCRLKFNRCGAFVAAALWGAHPLHTEAVTYMSATADPLFTLFCLTAVILILPEVFQRKVLAIIPIFLMGLASKETTVMLPILVMACMFYVDPKRFDFRTYMRTWPLWVITLAYVYWRSHAKGFDGPQTYDRFYGLTDFSGLKNYAENPLLRFYTFLATLPAYLKLLVWPTGLHMERSFSIYSKFWNADVVAGIAMVAGALAHIVYSARKLNKGMPLAWGLLWFAGAHAPDSGLLIPMNSLFLEHWMYLPTVGLFLGLAETLALLLRDSPRVVPAACAVGTLGFAAVLAGQTYQQNKIWHDPEIFYTNIFAYGETSARAHNNLALYYSNHQQFTKAIEQYLLAIKTSDIYAETHYNLALTYLQLPDQRGNASIAIEHLNRSLQIEPGFYRSYKTLGDVYAFLGDPAKAEDYHGRADALLAQRR